MLTRQRQIIVLIATLLIFSFTIRQIESAPSQQASTQSLKLIQRANLGVPAGNATTPRRLALNSQAGQVYLLSEGVPILKEGNHLSSYNLGTGEIDEQVNLNTGDNEALDLQFDPDNGLIYALWRSRTTEAAPVLSIIAASSLQPVQELPGLETIAAGGGQLYAANANQLIVFEAGDEAVVERQRLDLPPAVTGPIAINPATNRLYLARNINESWQMEIFEAGTLEAVGSYDADGPILQILPLPDRDEVFVVVAAGDFRLLHRLSSAGELLDLPYELGPRFGAEGIALSQDGQRLYYGSGELPPVEPTPGEETGPALMVLSVADLSPLQQLPLLTNFDDLAIDDETDQAFALYPYDNFLYVMDLDGETVEIVNTAIELRDILVDELAGELFVSDTSNRLRRLDAETLEVLAENHLSSNLPDYGFQSASWGGELSLDREQNRLYVSGLPALVFEADTLAEVTVLDPGGQLAPDPTTDRLYISNCGVTVLDSQTFEEIGTLPESQPREDGLVPNPCADYSRLDPQNQLLYSLVPNGIPGSNSGSYFYVYEVGLEPSLVFSDTNISILEVEPDPAGQRAFANYVRHSNRRVLTLDASQPEAMTYTEQLLGLWGEMVYDPDANQLYLSETDHNRLLALEAETLSVVDELALPPNYSFRLADLDPTTGHLYLIGLKGQLLVASTADGEEALSEDLAGLSSTDVTRTPDGKVLALELAGDTIVARIEASYSEYAAESHLYSSADQGQTWTDISQNLPLLPVQAMAVSPGEATTPVLFAGLLAPGQSGGLYKSTDGGENWQPAMKGLNDLWVNELFISPNFSQDGLIFAVTPHAGLHQSNDGGESWTPLANLDPNALFPVASSDYAVAFGGEGVALVSQGLEGMPGVFRATTQPDGVLSAWQRVLDIPVSTLALSPDGGAALAFGSSLWYSMDGGENWELGGAGLTGVENLVAEHILFSPTFADDHTVYFFFKDFSGSASGRLFRSTDGGQSWEAWSAPPSADIFTSVTMTPAGELLFGHDQPQVSLIDPASLSWATYLAAAATLAPLDDLAVSPDFGADETLFAISKQEGLFRSNNGGQGWASTPFPARSFGFTGERYRLAISPDFAGDKTLYVATGLSLHRSTDGGQSWDQLSPATSSASGESSTSQVQQIALSPNFGQDQILLAGTPAAVYRSTDGGDTWQEVLEATGEVSSIDVLRFAPDGQYAYAHFSPSSTLSISPDGGQTWQTEAGNPEDLFSVISSDVGPDNMLTVALEYDTRLLQAGPQTPPWQSLNPPPTTALANPSAVVYDPNGGLLIGGQGGVFRSMDNGQSWQPLPAEGLPVDSPVKALRATETQQFALMNDGRIFDLASQGDVWTTISVVK